jgi:EpsI family protein
MTRATACFTVAVAMLGAAGVGLLWTSGGRPSAPVARLDQVAHSLGGWQASNHVPAEVLPEDSRAPVQIVRTYHRQGETIWVAVSYYPTQTGRQRPPARDLLFPGSGWTDLSERVVDVQFGETSQDRIPATLILRRSGQGRVAVLYWYQLAGRAVASDHGYRARLLANRLLRGRSDGALVRVAVALRDEVTSQGAVRAPAEFLSVFYPELLRVLPR